MKSRLTLAVVVSIVCFCVRSFAQDSMEETDLYALLLAPTDIDNATRAMTIHDPNEDDIIDKDEQTRLSWRDDVAKYDLNKDGDLSHLELVVRYAKIRDDSDITQEHIDNANIFLRRHDANRNGQLDPIEIADGWPTEPDEFDTNHDGVITVGEIAARFSFMSGLRRAMGIEKVDQVTAIRTVRKFDQDKDQKLSPDEQVGAFLPLSADAFDETNDGKLEIIEIATMLAKHRQTTGLTSSDLQQIRALFERYDSNADGKIDQTEMAPLGGELPDSAVASRIAALDSNKDLEVTYQEAAAEVAKQRKKLGFTDEEATDARRLLVRHDTNRSNMIELSELFETPVSGQLAVSTMKQADTDKDQKITLQELARHLAKKAAAKR